MAQVYAGLFDDRLYWYPGDYVKGGCRLSEEFYKDNLVNSILLGDVLLINDGYLLQNPQIVKWLEQGNDTLFFMMCEYGYVKILSREMDYELVDLPKHAPTVPSLQKAFDNPTSGFDLNKVKTILGYIDVLNDNGRTIRLPWPKYEVSSGFTRLIDDMRALANDWNLQDRDPLNRTYDKFRMELQTGKGARTAWEDAVKDDSQDNESQQNKLMGIANVCYHLNFTAALKASDPQYKNIRVQTIEDFWRLADVSLLALQDDASKKTFNVVKDCLFSDKSLCLKYPAALQKACLQKEESAFVRRYLEDETLRKLRQDVNIKLEFFMKSVSTECEVKERLDDLREKIDDYNEAYVSFVNSCFKTLGDAVKEDALKYIVSKLNNKLEPIGSSIGRSVCEHVLHLCSKSQESVPGAKIICSLASRLYKDYQHGLAGGTEEVNSMETLGYKTIYLQKPQGSLFLNHLKYYKKEAKPF